jgi:plastocyanin
MGPPSTAVGKQFQKLLSDPNAFFPSKITVAVGDSVRFVPTGFHTVDIPKRGGKPVGLVAASGQKIANALDAAGAPFWFNGQDQIGFAPPLVKSAYGKTVTYSGAAMAQSGAPLGNKLKPFVVRFTKTGSFTYYCDIHPGMKGRVKVVAKGKRVPKVSQDTARVKAQVAAGLKVAKGLNPKPPANRVVVGAAGAGGIEKFAFFPAKLTVAPGTTVTFAMDKGSYDVHTATTGPGNPEKEPKSFLGTLAKAFENPVFDPPSAVYPSDAPGTVAGLTPASHGNGFWNSGVLDASSTTPLPASSSVRFDAAGTYDFYCLIHPFMKGTVTVQ